MKKRGVLYKQIKDSQVSVKNLGEWLLRFQFLLSEDMTGWAKADYYWFSMIKEKLEYYLGNLNGKRVLDAGCGERYGVTLQLHSLGVNVTGIDTLRITPGNSLKSCFKNDFIQNGKFLLQTIFLKRRAYYRELQNLCGFPLYNKKLDILTMDISDMAFPDNTFDAVVTIAVLEHVKNIPKAVSEIARCLSRGVLYLS